MAGVIEVEALVKQYGELRAVDGIDFSVERGEIFAFLGPNGAGKTTTCEILETLRRKTSGEARVLGLDVATEAQEVRERIGVLPQDFNAFETLTCHENLAYFAAMFKADPDLDELLARVGLTEKRDARYGTLSGGLKQRLGVAISLVNDPEVVFLDEPTTGLDPRARRDAWQVISDLKAQGKTVFLTTHYMEEAEVLADRVAIINRGRIVDLDRPDALIQRHAPGQRVRVHGGAALQGRFKSASEPVDGDLVIEVADGKALRTALIEVAAADGFSSLEVRSPTLEDVFLKLTGQTFGHAEEVDA